MLNAWNILFNGLWVLGCALALAAVSYASYAASQGGAGWRAQLAAPGVQRSLLLAGVLFCAGLAGAVTVLWQTLAWGALAALFGVQLLLT